jgi:hypothetical protein
MDFGIRCSDQLCHCILKPLLPGVTILLLRLRPQLNVETLPFGRELRPHDDPLYEATNDHARQRDYRVIHRKPLQVLPARLTVIERRHAGQHIKVDKDLE